MTPPNKSPDEQRRTFASFTTKVSSGSKVDNLINIAEAEDVIIYEAPTIQPLPRQEYLNRQNLLKYVHNEVTGRLSQSLYSINNQKDFTPINLHMQRLSGMVEPFWSGAKDYNLPQPNSETSIEKEIIEVFQENEIAGKLLILGKPGYGKTTTLLHLAIKLIELAQNDCYQPMPVLFKLSSWKDNNEGIAQWLQAQLRNKYGIRPDIGKQWLANCQLIPLFDSLDELQKSAEQEKCIEEINKFLKQDSRPPNLVVCSRLKVYQHRNIKLGLNGAVCLNPMTESQIHTYLEYIGRPELYQIIQNDSELRKIAESPLFLAILAMTLTHQEISGEQWQHLNSTKERLQYFSKIYIQQMLERKFESKSYKGKEPPRDKTEQWLANLAVKQGSQEFLIENMQPSSWLIENEQWVYSIGVRLIVGLISGLTAGLYLNAWTEDLNFLILAIISGILTGVISHVMSPLSELIEERFSRFSSSLISGGSSGLIFFLLESSLSWEILNSNSKLIFWEILVGIGVGIVFSRVFPQEIKPSDAIQFSPNKAIKPAIIGLLVALFFIPLHIILENQKYQSNYFYAFYELLACIILGGVYGAIQGTVVDLDLKTIPNQGIKRTLQYALIWFVLGGSIAGTLTWVMDDPDILRSIGIGLTVGLLGSLLAGSASGLTCIQHFTLRFILWCKGYIPWNYARFLNYSTELKFLKNVNGRYEFIHDSLQKYFAENGSQIAANIQK